MCFTINGIHVSECLFWRQFNDDLSYLNNDYDNRERKEAKGYLMAQIGYESEHGNVYRIDD